MRIKHDLLPKQKSRKNNLNVEIDLYPLATELYEELARIGIIERIKEIPQLGVIKVNKKLAKTRFDYIMFQLYLHKMIKVNLQGDLRYTYNNRISVTDFRFDYPSVNKNNKPTMGDILQILTIVYNIGHFYNTFTASRAITMLSSEDESFHDLIVNASENEQYQIVAESILENKNYQRLHLLNSLLILEHCDNSKISVILAKEILYEYINDETLDKESKMRYILDVFKKVRTVSYMAYDLQIAETPLIIDLNNEIAMCLLLKELLSEYNNNESSNYLVNSINKLLDDNVYNENSNAICYYKISRKIVTSLCKDLNLTKLDYYNDLFINKDSPFNKNYTHRRDFNQTQILKLTFDRELRYLSERLLIDLEKMNNTRVGYYDRDSGEQTILVSIRKNCDAATKRYTAFKVLKRVISCLRSISNLCPTDKRYLLVTKFFLYYLFDEYPVLIKPTINRNVCVICTRGKHTSIKEIQLLLKNSIGTEDENHEVEFLLSRIEQDTNKDTSITIPASILVYEKDKVGRNLCEFDGLIIYPMRKENQVLFLEAKNTDKKPSYGKKCLSDKFEKISFEYIKDDIQIVDKDAYWKFTL